MLHLHKASATSTHRHITIVALWTLLLALLTLEASVTIPGATRVPIVVEMLDPPDIISIDEEEFKKRVAEHGIIWQKSHPD